MSQVRQVRQVRQAGTYRVEYNATCPVIWNEVLPEDPKATGERVMECVERGIEEAVGSALDVKMRLELVHTPSGDAYHLSVKAVAQGPVAASPEDFRRLSYAVEDRVSLELAPLFGRVEVNWSFVSPNPIAPPAPGASGVVA